MEGCGERVQECRQPLHLQEAWGCKCTVKDTSFPPTGPCVVPSNDPVPVPSPSPSCATLDGIYLCR